MEFADFAWRAILAWLLLLVLIDAALKFYARTKEDAVVVEMENRDDTD